MGIGCDCLLPRRVLFLHVAHEPPAEEAHEAANYYHSGDGDARDRAGREAAPVRAGGCARVCLAVEGIAGSALLALTRPTAVCTTAYTTVKAPGPLLVGLLPFSARGALEGVGGVCAAGTILNTADSRGVICSCGTRLASLPTCSSGSMSEVALWARFLA